MTNKSKICISLILCSSMLLAGCGNNTSANTGTTLNVATESEKDVFAEEYKNAVSKIKEMNTSSEYLIGVIDSIWEEFGADYVMTTIKTIVSCTSEESLKNASVPTRWLIAKALYPDTVDESTADIKAGFDSVVYKKVEQFNNNIDIISNNKEEVDILIKEMRNTYSEHSDEIGKLHEYYVESALLAELALAPDGSLLTYRSSFSEMKDNISRAEKYADIY